MPTGFFFDSAVELLEVGEHFALLLDWEDPHRAGVVVDEGNVVVASADRRDFSRSPYIQVDDIKEAFAYVVLLWEWESMLFSALTCFAHLVDSFRLECRQSDDDSL